MPKKASVTSPSFFDARLAAANNWSCLTGLPSLSNYSSINVMRSVPITTETVQLLIVVNFSYSGVAWHIMPTSGANKGKLTPYTHIDFKADAPLAVRGSRKTVSLQNVTQHDQLQGLVKVAVTSAPLSLEENASAADERITEASVDELTQLCEASNQARNISSASFVSGMAFHCALASVISAAEWQTYSAAETAAQFVADSKVGASSSILILLPATEIGSEQVFNIQVNSQIACRYSAASLHNSNTKPGTPGFSSSHSAANQLMATTVKPTA